MTDQDFSYVDSTEYRLTVSLAMAGFFTLFLLVFRPFGVDNHDPDHRYTTEFVLAMALFGVATALTALANEFGLRPRLRLPATRAGVIVWGAWTCLLIGLVDFLLYNWFGNWHDFHLASAAGFVFDCAKVLVFPLVGSHFYFRHRNLRERFDAVIGRAETASDPERLVVFEGPGATDRIELRLRDFLFARAQDNYVEIHYRAGGEERKHLLRATLAGVAATTRGLGVIRCHRSYLVNLHQVVAARGRGSRLSLELAGSAAAIPVSRSHADATLEALEARRSAH